MLFSLSGIFSNPVDRMMEYDLKTLWTGLDKLAGGGLKKCGFL